ncbi:Uncharacterised protein [Mycobacteroides abscessus subsp. abscessus]|nr:Uncharacterised protein [Mycobacteroides abscessus subsp. abscessus]
MGGAGTIHRMKIEDVRRVELVCLLGCMRSRAVGDGA